MDTISQCLVAGKTKILVLDWATCAISRVPRGVPDRRFQFSSCLFFRQRPRLPRNVKRLSNGYRGAATTPAQLLFITVVRIFDCALVTREIKYAGNARFNSHRDCVKLRTPKNYTVLYTEDAIFAYLCLQLSCYLLNSSLFNLFPQGASCTSPREIIGI
jgi:hypothetical protein